VPGALLAGRYQVEAIIGQGAFGRVFRAVDRYSGEVVALKEFIREPGRHDSFLREVGILFDLVHPAIMSCHTMLVWEPFRYIVCEYMGAGSLRDHLVEHPDEVLGALDLLCDAAEGVSFAHERGVVHRDLKPENILLHRAGGRLRAKVSDFGISTLGSSPHHSCVGSPAYMAPEQFHDRADQRADIYALGVMLYEILCGQRPFSGSPAHLMACHLQRDPEMPAWLPRPVTRVLRKSLAKRPEKRFSSVDALITAIHAALDDRTRAALAEGWPSHLDQVEALAVTPTEVVVQRASRGLRLSGRGRVIEDLDQVDALRAAGSFVLLRQRDRLLLRGPGVSRVVSGAPTEGEIALSAEGALAFVVDGKAVVIDEQGKHQIVDGPGPCTALAFTGPDQRLYRVHEQGSRATLEQGATSRPLTEPIARLYGHPDREELIARSRLDPRRLALIQARGIATTYQASGDFSCDGESFYAADDDGGLVSIHVGSTRVAHTRWPQPLAAVGVGGGRLAWAAREGSFGLVLTPSPLDG
jgi:serine/threonine-protein kinase